MWLGPPSSHMSIAEVFREELEGADWARAFKTSARPRLARPETPTFRKFRRFKPSQYRPVAPRSRWNIFWPPQKRTLAGSLDPAGKGASWQVTLLYLFPDAELPHFLP